MAEDIKASMAKGKDNDALIVATQELAKAKESGDRKLQADAAVLLAEIYIARQQPEMALRTVKEALLLRKYVGDQKTQAAILQTVASAFVMVSAGEQALRAATALEAVTGRMPEKGAQADARRLAAQALLSMGNPETALTKAQEAVDLHKAATSKHGLGVALQTLAEVQLRRQSADAALKAGKDATVLFKELGERPGQASALNAVAGAYQLLGEHDEGLKAAREALLLFRQVGDARGEAVAKATCACLRPRPQARAPTKALARPTPSNVPSVTGVATNGPEAWVDATRIMGSAEARHLVGMVAVVTGASRGIGKGVATILAETGAIVYVTARSTPSKITEPGLRGSVDETATALSKLGGVGVALHVDHAQKSQTAAVSELIANSHGRLDVLVNNAYCLPGPDENFYGTPLWQQPVRYLDEQMAVGTFNHVAQTLQFLPCLRRGKGLAVNISGPGAQGNVAKFPTSHACSRAALERTMSALSERVRCCGVYVLTLWPGCVKTERNKATAERAGGAKLVVDGETCRFTGFALRRLAGLKPPDLARLASTRRTLSCADVAKLDLDGYAHEGDLRTFTNTGRAHLVR